LESGIKVRGQHFSRQQLVFEAKDPIQG
jgi:hypothetical protein